jgi:LL-diaminopimelate aminotransferase
VRKIILDRADRLQRMPPEFTNLDRLAARLDKRSTDIIDLATIDNGLDPDFDIPAPAVADLASSPDSKAYHRFCQRVTRYFDQVYGIALNPEQEILPVAGTSAALFLLGLAYVDPGEMVLLPDPGPPIYRSAAALCSAGIQTFYLHDRYHYLPDCRTVAAGLAGRTKLWILGYPHNPSTALADRDLITEVIRLARKRDILLVYDGTFALLADQRRHDAEFLANRRARTTGVEILSFDHNFGLGHLHLAAVIGNREAIAGMTFLAASAGLMPNSGILGLGSWAMQNAERLLRQRRKRFAESRAILTAALDELQWEARGTDGLPFCWLTLPRRFSSLGFARRLLRRTGIKIAPGTVFGEQGEGYARISLLTDPAKMKTAAGQLVEFGRLWKKRRRPRGDRE